MKEGVDDAPELVRHKLFRDWLRENPDEMLGSNLSGERRKKRFSDFPVSSKYPACPPAGWNRMAVRSRPSL